MSKKATRRSTPAPTETANQGSKPPVNMQPRPVRWGHVVLFLVISIGGTYLAIAMRPTSIPRYTFEVINKYPHDKKAFTQGLVYENGVLWESTGRYGESTIRKVDRKSGKVLKKTDLSSEYFGEGCTRWQDSLIQLTWKEEKIFVYDLELNKIAEHDFDGHGWGITHDGKSLIVSDGTSTLRFLDPQTFKETRSVIVRDDRRRISNLNELEYVGGKVLANSWQSDFIYEINPANGHVESVIDLSGLWPSRERPADGVLNGIAFDPKAGRLLVTGKLCPWIYEIQLKLIK